MQICPVCFWEDAPGEHPYNSSNEVRLIAAQYNFLAMRAAEPEYIEIVRAPLPEEARSLRWLSIEDIRLKLIGMINDAFRDTELDGGTTLHQSLEFDCLGYPDDWTLAEAAARDPETRWQDIPVDKISRFSESMICFDAKSLRFHLPAYMCHALRCLRWRHYEAEASGVMYQLSGGPRSKRMKNCADLLDRSQKESIATFLHLFSSLDGSAHYDDATEGLENGWSEWIPEFVRLVSL